MGERISRRKLIKRAALGATGLLALDAFGIEPRWIEAKGVTIPIKDLSPEFDGYRIALLSDFHIPRTSRHRVHRALEMVNQFQPDLILMPGDFVHGPGHGKPHSTPMPDFRGYFEGFDAPDGVLGTLGNHDHWQDAPGVRKQLALHTKVKLIENTHAIIVRGTSKLAIGGVGDLWQGVVDPDRAFVGVPDGVPRILLSHNPDLAEEMTSKVRVDLQVSGHTHGGEIRIPFGPAPIIPSRYGYKFRCGLVQGKVNRVYVTRGIASVSYARLCCRPEVTCMTLVRASLP